MTLPNHRDQESGPVCAQERSVRIFDSQHVITISSNRSSIKINSKSKQFNFYLTRLLGIDNNSK